MGKRLYRFGPYELDTGERVLLREGQSLALKPKVFHLLEVLVENSGHVVCKDELMKQVWADSFVEESNLAVSICEIRKVLGGRSNGHTYIETVPRRGYRFAACVTEETQLEGLSVAPPNVTSTSGGVVNPSKSSFAVLPFELIGGSSGEYLGLGIANALITKLSNLRQVTVRPTNSIRKYLGSHDPVVAGTELGVQWVLDGRVQRSDKRIRLTVQLIKVDDGVLQWAEKFDEKFTDIFSVEDSISELVANALAPKLSGKEKRLLAKRSTENAEAYEAYLKGRFCFDKRTVEGTKKGIKYRANTTRPRLLISAREKASQTFQS